MDCLVGSLHQRGRLRESSGLGVCRETGDARNPQSVYGRSKAEAEVRLPEVLPDCCIARTSWLFGTGGKCFPNTILKLAASRPALDVVNDQRGCPTYTVD